MDNKRQFTCDWIFNILVVLCDGKVVCGCADPRGERPLGNINDQGLHSIWTSEKVKDIRRGLNLGYAPFCLDCGLKRYLKPGEKVIKRPVELDTIPRVFIEPTILCNLSCFQSVCSKESGIINTRSKKNLSFQEFKKIVDEVGNTLVRLDLFNYGEPFVHPQAVEMIEYTKQKYPGIYLYISTNGLMLDDEKIQRIVAAGVDEFTFSVDGADQETYEKYRCGGNFQKVLNIMKRFVEERNKIGKEIPFINWRCILFKWNDSKQHMNKIQKLAEKIGVDRFTWEITDHPEAGKSEKYQIGTKHWEKIFFEIWDTSGISNALKNKRFSAKIKVLSSPVKALVSKPTRVKVKVKNIGGAYWPDHTFSGRRLIRLGAQLYDLTKNLIDQNYARAFLPRPISAGQSATLDIELPEISEIGDYWLKFDMVSEGVDWFEPAGSTVTWKKMKVINTNG
ncbi:MAG: radical SAM protein [Candidatus Aminicenantes bacterium]|nr:radical SAM protein [Candidatus Aminicenantes bacterium]